MMIRQGHAPECPERAREETMPDASLDTRSPTVPSTEVEQAPRRVSRTPSASLVPSPHPPRTPMRNSVDPHHATRLALRRACEYLVQTQDEDGA